MAAAELTDTITIVTAVVGINHHPGKSLTELRVKREPLCEYDPNALAVENGMGELVGYIPRTLSKFLSPHIDINGGDTEVIPPSSLYGLTDDDFKQRFPILLSITSTDMDNLRRELLKDGQYVMELPPRTLQRAESTTLIERHVTASPEPEYKRPTPLDSHHQDLEARKIPKRF